jgi:outer membrane autotransporter protein
VQWTSVIGTYFGYDGQVGRSNYDWHGVILSNSANSLRSDVGFRVFYQWQIGKLVLEPSLKAAWEHEYKYSALPITAGFAGVPGPSATFFGPSEGHDSAVISAGISAQWTSALSIYVSYDGQLGRQNYDSNAVTGGFRISFAKPNLQLALFQSFGALPLNPPGSST